MITASEQHIHTCHSLCNKTTRALRWPLHIFTFSLASFKLPLCQHQHSCSLLRVVQSLQSVQSVQSLQSLQSVQSVQPGLLRVVQSLQSLPPHRPFCRHVGLSWSLLLLLPHRNARVDVRGTAVCCLLSVIGDRRVRRPAGEGACRSESSARRSQAPPPPRRARWAHPADLRVRVRSEGGQLRGRLGTRSRRRGR